MLFMLFVGPIILALEEVQRWAPARCRRSRVCRALGIWRWRCWFGRRSTPLRRLFRLCFSRAVSLAGRALGRLPRGRTRIVITFLPIYLRAVRGTSPAETGLLLLPLTFGIGLGSLVAGQLVTRTGRTAIFPSYAYNGGHSPACWASHFGCRIWPANCPGFSAASPVHGDGDGRGAGDGAGRCRATDARYRRGDGAVFPFRRRRLWYRQSLLFSFRSRWPAIRKRRGCSPRLSIAGRKRSRLSRRPGSRSCRAKSAKAFRAAFLTIAMFTGIGALLAFSMPLRKV